jgi:sulfur transfer protein SufE
MIVFDDLSFVSLDELQLCQNWQAQYRLIIQWGSAMSAKPGLRLAENLLKGCEVTAWFAHSESQGVHRFGFDSDSRVVNGLAALLISNIDQKTTGQIQPVDFSRLLLQLNLDKYLTPSRNNGVAAMIAQVQTFMQPFYTP